MSVTTTTSLKLDGATRARVQRLAALRQRSAHWLMREAVEQYLAREEARETLQQDVLARWADFQASGLHVTSDQVDAWLARLEAGEDVAPPECQG